MSEPVTQRSDALHNRQKLIDAARAVFAERGLNAEMKEIADRAGLGIGTIYRNFATKDELIAAIMDDLVQDATCQLREVMAIPEPRIRLQRMLDLAWHTVETHGALVLALGGGRDLRPECKPAPPTELIESLIGTVREGIAAGVFRDDLPADFVAYYLMAQFHSFLTLATVMPVESLRANMSRLILGALSPGAAIGQV
jgi:AcrR family transcriptional regulator